VDTHPDAALEAVDLTAGYRPGLDILKGVTVHVRPGQLVSILGPNGAGKSTLVKAIFGLVQISGGQCRYGDDDITGWPAHRLVGAGLGYVPQTQNVFAALTVRENLIMGGYLARADRADRIAEVGRLLPMLADRAGQRAGTLSGGQRQLVALGRALMMRPRVLLLDEPSAGLDPKSAAMIFGEIRRIAESGICVLMVEQNARRALRISDYAYVLDMGQNRYQGTGAELLHDKEVERLYLGGSMGLGS
jgi:branched-chain amino acid transport system ATP-binding protein